MCPRPFSHPHSLKHYHSAFVFLFVLLFLLPLLPWILSLLFFSNLSVFGLCLMHRQSQVWWSIYVPLGLRFLAPQPVQEGDIQWLRYWSVFVKELVQWHKQLGDNLDLRSQDRFFTLGILMRKYVAKFKESLLGFLLSFTFRCFFTTWDSLKILKTWKNVGRKQGSHLLRYPKHPV